jgi:hypothetical protein
MMLRHRRNLFVCSHQLALPDGAALLDGWTDEGSWLSAAGSTFSLMSWSLPPP